MWLHFFTVASIFQIKVSSLPQTELKKKKTKYKKAKKPLHTHTHHPHVFTINISPDTTHAGAHTLALSMCEIFLGEFRL